MNSIHLFWEHSPLWLLPVMLLSAALTWWHYSGIHDFPRFTRLILIGLRFVLYCLCGLLLLNPLLRYFKENRVPPVSVVLVDNSRSVSLSSKPDSLNLFRKNLADIIKKLESQGSKVFIEGLDGPLSGTDSLSFNEGNTNLEKAISRIRNSIDGRNLAQIILASDGIINMGSDLQDAGVNCKINCIALGNPVPGKDLRIRDVKHNKLVYLGNQFPVYAEIQSTDLSGRMANLRLKEGGVLLESKTISLSSLGLAKAEFNLRALKKGMHEYELEIEPLEGEINLENNSRKFFIQVVSDKKKVLILASCPHPDIKAIRNALEPLEQLEVRCLTGGIDAYQPAQYDLIILHQLPDKPGNYQPQVSQLLKKTNAGLLLIATPFTDFNRLRADASGWLEVQGGNGQAEESGNRFDPAFQRFQLDENYRQTIAGLPPVKSPGASFRWKGPSETVLDQLIGRVSTPTPLLSIQSGPDGRKAVFWGDGLWLWRLNEFGRNDNTESTDNLIQKTCQLLINSQGRKQLQVINSSDEYSESEIPVFRIETFNQLMEPVYDKKVNLTIRNNSGKEYAFSMLTAPGNPPLRTRNLPTGAYHFTASSQMDGKEFREEGDFIVRSFDIEARQLQANHPLLRNLSEKNGGIFCGIAGMNRIAEKAVLPPPLVEFTDWNENLLEMKWMLLLLLALLSAEWLIRKFNGSL